MYEIMVLMSTYNGEKYLKTQIDSILTQEDVKVNLLVRDDGSSDRTRDILQEYKEAGKLDWYFGDNLCSAKSFINLLQESEDCEFYAFSDQDDLWLHQKLINAVKILEKQDATRPALYYSGTILVDEKLNKIAQEHEHRVFTKFCNAVVSSCCTGCTMCFNKSLRDLINIYKPNYQIMHDGWIHKVCLAVDGFAYYDTNSYIYYRQHSNNVIGGTSTPYKRWKRRINTVKSNPCSRSKGIAEILKAYSTYMPKENREICEKIVRYKQSIFQRLRLVLDHTIFSTNKRIDKMYRITVLLGLF